MSPPEREPHDDAKGNGRPIYYGVLADPRSSQASASTDPIYQKLADEIFNPDPLRSHVITLHLYVEYWLDKLAALNGVDENLMFFKKAEALHAKKILIGDLYDNMIIINNVRNKYAHELDLKSVTPKIRSLLRELKVDKRFETNDDDRLRAVAVQTIFELDRMCANGGKPLPTAYPHAKTREKLLADGRLFWQDCEPLRKETPYKHVTVYVLRCPLCQKGEIEREYDATPGNKESVMDACSVCGLSGDGSALLLETAKPEFRSG